jgi:rare lipoprotein A
MNKRLFLLFIIVFLGVELIYSQTEKLPKSKTGLSSYYSQKYHNKKTASGEKYDMYDFTAAHPSLAFGTKLKVTNLKNNKSILVRVNDRGPFVRGRLIDVSYSAALKLDMVKTGTAKVKIEVVTGGEDFLATGGKEIASKVDDYN